MAPQLSLGIQKPADVAALTFIMGQSNIHIRGWDIIGVNRKIKNLVPAESISAQPTAEKNPIISATPLKPTSSFPTNLGLFSQEGAPGIVEKGL